MLLEFFDHLLSLFLDTAVWLLLGLVLAAVLKGWIPTTLVEKWLSGTGAGSVIRAALIGAPLPLCSCGVLPTAIALRRSGASKPATVSFLVATPETGVDSISVTYALLGPVMAIIRPISAIISAVVSGIMILLFDNSENSRNSSEKAVADTKEPCCCSKKKISSCSDKTEELISSCCSKTEEPVTSCCNETEKNVSSDHSETEKTVTGCCSKTAVTESSCCTEQSEAPKQSGILAGLQFAIVDILDDISKWLTIGLVLAAVVATLVEPAGLSQWGSGLSAMLLMLVVGLPLYICATASTPLAAALLAAGMSPGAILVFLLVGPATNIASIGILSRELGIRAVVIYLLGISICAVLLGLATDAILSDQMISAGTTMAHHDSGGFIIIQWVAAVTLFVLAVKPLRRLIWKDSATACA